MEWAKFLLPLPVFQQEENETCIDFLRRIQYSLDKPNEMLKEDAVFWFLLGCREEIVTKIPYYPEESMWIEPDKLEEQLALIDKGVQLPGPHRLSRFQNTFNFFVCYKCGRYSHKSLYCKFPEPESSVGRALKRKITELHYSDEPKPTKSKSKKKAAANRLSAGPLSTTSTATHHSDSINDSIANIDQYKSQSQMGNSSLDFVNFEASSTMLSPSLSSYRESSSASQDRNPNSMYNNNNNINNSFNSSSTSYMNEDYSHVHQQSSFNTSQNQQNSTFDSQNSYKSPTAKQLPSLFDSFESPSVSTFSSFKGDNRSTSISNTFHSSSKNNKSNNNSRFNSPMSKSSTNSNFKNNNSYNYDNDNDFDEPITRISRNPQSQSSRN